ncbi:MAG: FAD-dependent oxidoreductase [Phycisphaerales bacterium]
MPRAPEVIVVGLGAAGSATLLALARRGVPCIGIDRFDPPHDRGSSHGHSRLIRLCYYEHADYVPLLRESYRLWSELQSRTDAPVFRLTGGLYIGTEGSPFVAGSLQSARLHGLEHELLDRAGAAARFPQFVIRPDEVPFYEPTTGVLFPENAIATTLAWAISEPDGSAHYGFPVFPAERDGTVPGGAGFKVALHKAGEPTDPETVDRVVRPEEIRALAGFVQSRIPAGCNEDCELLETRVCLYTGTRDGHFLIDAHPDHNNVVVVSACSGHGFKFAPALGSAEADLAVDGRTKLPIEFLGWRAGCSMR